MTVRVKNAIRDPLSHAVIFTDRNEYARALQRRQRSKEIGKQREEHEHLKERVKHTESLRKEHEELKKELADLKALVKGILGSADSGKGNGSGSKK